MYAVEIGGGKFQIYDKNVGVHEKLPNTVYRLDFNENTGFYLTMLSDFVINEKLYGSIIDKIKLVVESYDKAERSVGVILSGKKGLGKSIASKKLCQLFIEKGLPVILVGKAIPGIANYIQSIDQEAVLLFDEFDKNFKDNGYCDFSRSFEASTVAQVASNELLPLFDGIDSQKRVYIINCNKVSDISQYLINRPGRFHFHFILDYPSEKDIVDYLRDNLKDPNDKIIREVILLSKRTKLNYDSLRAICFELNIGHSFDDIERFLNIYELYYNKAYNVTVTLRGHNRDILGCYYVNSTPGYNKTDKIQRVDLHDPVTFKKVAVITFDRNLIEFDRNKGIFTINDLNKVRVFTYDGKKNAVIECLKIEEAGDNVYDYGFC